MPLVLVVDDHSAFRRVARIILEAGGFRVAEAASGREAMTATRELAPDVVLLDIQLPDVSGFEVAEVLLVDGGSPRIVLTSTRDPGDFGDRLARSAAAGFIPKAALSAAALRKVLEAA